MTQPLGIGVLLAALMQAKCQYDWYPPLVAALLKNNGKVIEQLEGLSCSAVTDITGFGLAGHLYEMAKASQVCAELELNKITLLPGVESLIQSGLESTLVPENKWIESFINCHTSLKNRAKYLALFDPQTNGGMLIGIPVDQVAESLKRLQQNGFEETICIGRVTEKSDDHVIKIVE